MHSARKPVVHFLNFLRGAYSSNNKRSRQPHCYCVAARRPKHCRIGAQSLSSSFDLPTSLSLSFFFSVLRFSFSSPPFSGRRIRRRADESNAALFLSPLPCVVRLSLSPLKMLRLRYVAVLRVVALRTVTSPTTPPSYTPSTPLHDVEASTPSSRRSSILPGSEVADTAPETHHSPVQQAGAARKIYGKEGYNFIEHLRTSGPGAALGRVRWMLSLYVSLGAVAVVYLVYYLTTYTYVLTTNPAPYRNSLFQHFPCDLAIIENKMSHKRHIVEVTSALEPHWVSDDSLEGNDDAAAAASAVPHDSNTAAGTPFVRPAPAIVQRKLHINALLHRVFIYLQKSHSLVLVNAQAELNPLRFMNGAGTVGHDARAPVAFLREDQLLPDASSNNGVAAGAAPPPTRSSWWRLWSSTPQAEKTAASSTAAVKGPVQVYIDSEVRLRDAMNGYQKGHLHTYEQTISHVVQTKLAERFYQYVLERGMAEHPGLRKVYAEEMMRNGLISGTGVTLSMLVPDVQQFADEVLDDVKAKFGDDVIVYAYTVKLR